ncbi:MAG: DUF4145 domain-containing protein [Candidatus Shapirobacteria bacterium]|nr:DUF4145 domain-containing protein [Candidatus Shapirobacteria bacterium]
MNCPHCLHSFHDSPSRLKTGGWMYYDKTIWNFEYQECPECKKLIGKILISEDDGIKEIMAYPKKNSRTVLPDFIDKQFLEDYNEACSVINESPKASAALSRRCLQNILREKAMIKRFDTIQGKYITEKITPSDLSKEIQQVLDMGNLTSNISEGLDAIRAIGNFAAHPIKSTNTGEIFSVETGEAEWNLEILESLFDYYFIQPKNIQDKKNALNIKLKSAGKPEIK